MSLDPTMKQAFATAYETGGPMPAPVNGMYDNDYLLLQRAAIDSEFDRRELIVAEDREAVFVEVDVILKGLRARIGTVTGASPVEANRILNLAIAASQQRAAEELAK